ncbi:MAG: ABC transporter substrate-binding protein [Dehalococcoidia bacterium]
MVHRHQCEGVALYGRARVRQAIGYLIDRQRFIDTILFGFGDATDLPWPLDSPANAPGLAQQYSFDPQKAKSLLAAAGVSSGSSTDITVSQLYTSAQEQATLLQQAPTSVGINAMITKLEHAQYLPILTSGGFKCLWALPSATTSSIRARSFWSRFPTASRTPPTSIHPSIAI